MKRLSFIGVALLVVAVAGVALSAGQRLERLSRERATLQGPLYLPDRAVSPALVPGHASTAADAVYLWAIQHYTPTGSDSPDRFRHLEHLFDRVITELDPAYVDAYWLGALMLILEAGETDAGLRLLDKGVRRNPEVWILPYLAAWESYHVGRLEPAAEYFRLASNAPGAPAAVQRLEAGMMSKAGDTEASIRLWREIAADPATDARTLDIARRQLKELLARDGRARLEGAIERFRVENGRPPARLELLVQAQYIESLPRAADGRPYAYDPRTGAIE